MRYLGREIEKVVWAELRAQGNKWYVQVYHSPTGLPYDSRHCPHFYTLREAREYVRDQHEQAAAYETLASGSRASA